MYQSSFRDQLISASLKPRRIRIQEMEDEWFPESADLGLIEALVRPIPTMKKS